MPWEERENAYLKTRDNASCQLSAWVTWPMFHSSRPTSLQKLKMEDGHHSCKYDLLTHTITKKVYLEVFKQTKATLEHEDLFYNSLHLVPWRAAAGGVSWCVFSDRQLAPSLKNWMPFTPAVLLFSCTRFSHHWQQLKYPNGPVIAQQNTTEPLKGI